MFIFLIPHRDQQEPGGERRVSSRRVYCSEEKGICRCLWGHKTQGDGSLEHKFLSLCLPSHTHTNTPLKSIMKSRRVPQFLWLRVFLFKRHDYYIRC